MRPLSQRWKTFVSIIAGMLGLVFLYMGVHHLINSYTLTPMLLAGASIVTFLSFPVQKKWLETKPRPIDYLLIAIALGVSGYAFVHSEDFLTANYAYTRLEAWLGFALTLVLLEATRRTVGVFAVGMISFFFIYFLFLSPYMPGRFWHAAANFDTMFGYLMRSEQGYFVSLSYLIAILAGIYLFLGPVLFRTGVGDIFFVIARWVGSKISGGAGIVSVLTSMGFGSISGSAVANVVATGTYTIPMMKRTGYTPEFAGAVESTASTGGQIMPPIMGAAAFLMPEFIGGIHYIDVVIAAAIPGFLFFLSVGFGNYLFSKRHHVGQLTGEEKRELRDVLKEWRGIPTFIGAMGTMLYLLIQRWPVLTAGAWAVLVGAALHILITKPFTWSGIKKRCADLARGWVEGGRNFAWVFVFLCALSSMIMIIGRGGIGTAISFYLLDATMGNLFIVLLMTMAAGYILGMGITTTAAYVLVVAVLAKPMEMVIPIPLVAHLFIFWTCILGGITPPVCVTVYPAAALAGARWLPVAYRACALGAVLFFLPFFFAYNPALMLMGTTQEVLYQIIKAAIGIYFMSAGFWGYMLAPATWFERILFIVGGLTLAAPFITTDIIGLAVLLVTTIYHVLVTRRRSRYIPQLKVASVKKD